MPQQSNCCWRIQVGPLRVSDIANHTDSDINSQGAALIAASVTDVSAAVKAKIAGVVLFGYTKNQQNRGVIPGGYPAGQTKVYCNIGDLVCTGSLTITAAHLTYGRDASSAAQFLQGTL